MLVLAAASLFTVHAVAAASPVVIVDWTRVLKDVDPKAYGVDCPACLDPAWTHSANLLRPLAAMGGRRQTPDPASWLGNGDSGQQ